MNLKTNLKEEYNPLYFLSSLGAGGLGVSIYMYLMFMIKHPKTPMSTFEQIFSILTNASLASVFVAIALICIAIMAFIHFRLLFWNLKEYKIFKTTKKYQLLKTTNDEVMLMAIPLTLAMSVNVCFVLGMSFVPGLWSVVEFLFPFAIAAFFAIGVYSLKLYGSYITRVISTGGFDFEKNSNFSQMLAVFAFAMISVGFAAPGAMSHFVAVSALSLFCSIFFMILATLLILITLFLGIKSMYRYGVSPEAAGTLWVLIPISTLLGIAIIRISFGLVHNFEQLPSNSFLFFATSSIVSFQIIVGLFGYSIMKKQNYFKEYVYSKKQSVTALGLICPGVAFFVFGMFFIAFGLLKNGVIEIFSLSYFIVLAPFVLVQLKTTQTFFSLVKKLIIQS